MESREDRGCLKSILSVANVRSFGDYADCIELEIVFWNRRPTRNGECQEFFD